MSRYVLFMIVIGGLGMACLMCSMFCEVWGTCMVVVRGCWNTRCVCIGCVRDVCICLCLCVLTEIYMYAHDVI